MTDMLNQWREDNHNWKGGTSRSTIRRLTKRLLEEANRDLYLCERCGSRSIENRWPVHHRDHDRSNNDVTNLEVLCIACHNVEHNRDKVRESGRFAWSI